jgi:hypothetical protein
MKQLDTFYRVQDGIVVEGPKYMHGPWRNVANLECLSPAELAALGWLPAWDAESVAGPGEKLTATVLSAEMDRVVVSRLKEPLSDAEFNDDINRQMAAQDGVRDDALSAGVLHAGKRWHVDTVFAVHLMAMLQAYDNGIVPANSRQPVRTLDNTVEMLLRTEIVPLAAAVMARQQQIYGQSWAAKDALRAQLRA